ncbi:hypothetical protein LPICM02_40044 [Pseudolactococcus piscium]|nr:hypothetical protein LPICM02_40044 [Lactococcus piscium]
MSNSNYSSLSSGGISSNKKAKIREVYSEGNEIRPNGPKNKDKTP